MSWFDAYAFAWSGDAQRFVSHWSALKEENIFYKQLSYFKNMLKFQHVREDLVDMLYSKWKREQEGYSLSAFRAQDAAIDEFWGLSNKSQLFSPEEQGWISEINQSVERKCSQWLAQQQQPKPKQQKNTARAFSESVTVYYDCSQPKTAKAIKRGKIVYVQLV